MGTGNSEGGGSSIVVPERVVEAMVLAASARAERSGAPTATCAAGVQHAIFLSSYLTIGLSTSFAKHPHVAVPALVRPRQRSQSAQSPTLGMLMV